MMRSWRRSHGPLAGLLLPGCLLLAGGAAGAAPPKKDKAPAAAVAAEPDPVPELVAALQSAGGAALEAAEKLAALTTPRAFEAMLSELVVGVSPKVASVLLDSIVTRKDLKEQKDPQLLEVLSLYSSHRSPEIRKKALTGIGALPGPRTSALLTAALADSSGDVRAAAAQALGQRREKAAEPALIKLLSRGDVAAAQALGQIGGPDTARGLAEMVGTLSDRLLGTTLGELLLRADFGPDPLRLEVVQTLGKLAGSETVDVLSDYAKATEKEKGRPSRVEALKIIEQRTAK